MEKLIFMQDDAVMELLNESKYRSVNLDLDRIEIHGAEKVQFDGSQKQLRMVCRIEKLEIVTTIFPVASVNKRPTCGCCTSSPGSCSHRNSEGRCTEDPENREEPCKFNRRDEDDN